MKTIEMIKNISQRNSVVNSNDVLAVFDELDKAQQRIAELEAKLSTPVRLPDERTLWNGEDDYDTGHVKGWNAYRIESVSLLRKQGFKVIDSNDIN